VVCDVSYIVGLMLQKNSQWHMSHLLIPEQTGTPDSCDIRNEEAVVDFQDKHNLITLGWIHVSLVAIFTYLLVPAGTNGYWLC